MVAPATSLFPPLRFALLACSPSPLADNSSPTSLYRGSLPKPHNLPFLDSLHLKTVLSLTPKSLATYEEEGKIGPTKRRRGEGMSDEESVSVWAQRRGVKVVHVKVDKSKDGSLPCTVATIKQVLEILIVRENLPCYVHDLDGSDVLAMMGAALRKLQGWSEKAWSEEMARFLRAPPPAPEHLIFLRRLLYPTPPSNNSTTSDRPLSILVPAPSQRAPWLWPAGMPKKGAGHASMRVKVLLGEEGEKEEVERVGEREGRRGEGEKVPFEEEEEEEDEDEEEEDEEATPLSQMIDALDLGL